jgi:hypothetical protein
VSLHAVQHPDHLVVLRDSAQPIPTKLGIISSVVTVMLGYSKTPGNALHQYLSNKWFKVDATRRNNKPTSQREGVRPLLVKDCSPRHKLKYKPL